MAAAAATTSKAVRRKSLVSRTLERCRSALSGGGGSARAPPAGCFSVYVGPERERFVVRAECVNHPLFRRLLDDAEREYGYAAQGPLALPCGVDAFIDVLWQIDHDDDSDDGGDGEVPMAAAASPICGMQRCSPGSKGRAAGYRVLSPAKSTSPESLVSRPSPTSGRER